LKVFCSLQFFFGEASSAPITEVQHRLGHANLAITLLVYSHFFKHAESDVADRLADALLNFSLAFEN
jgi:integrase